MKKALRRLSRQLRLQVACAMACAGAVVPAQAMTGPELHVSGFGSVIATKLNADGLEYVNPGQTSGAGRDWSFKNDSRLGVQLDATFNDRYSATVQLLSKHNGNGNSSPGVEWAFGKAKLGGGFVLRAGRLGAPFFAVSDFREVGYANTWLRTPTPVYGQNFLRTFDGVDLGYSGEVATLPFTLQLLTGGTTVKYERTDADFKKLFGMNATLELTEGLALRLGQVRGRLTAGEGGSLGQLLAVLSTTPFASVGNELRCADSKASFSGVGLTLDRNDWVGSAEYTQRRSTCYVSDTTGWYVMAGRRFGAFTPYAVVARVKVDDANVVNTIPVGVTDTLTALSAGVSQALDIMALAHHSVALGLRWDAWQNTAVKAQWERIDTDGGRGMFRLTGDKPSGVVQALSVGVDFVF